jgi:hypothetical protein
MTKLDFFVYNSAKLGGIKIFNFMLEYVDKLTNSKDYYKGMTLLKVAYEGNIKIAKELLKDPKMMVNYHHNSLT